MKLWTHTAFSFPWVTSGTKTQNIWSSFIFCLICARPFDQELWSSLIYFFYLQTTIRPKSMVLISLFLLLAHYHLTKIYGPFSFIFSFVHDYSIKNYDPHWFISFYTAIRPKYIVLFRLFFHLRTTILPKIWSLIDLFCLFEHNHWTKIHGPLSFILSSVDDHSTKD